MTGVNYGTFMILWQMAILTQRCPTLMTRKGESRHAGSSHRSCCGAYDHGGDAWNNGGFPANDVPHKKFGHSVDI
jgi:hypothetical protein